MPYTDDWRRESARMASTYQNSYITTAATKSANGQGGCFSAASPLDIDYPLSTESVPFLMRGWAYQKRLLAPRVLHFCQKELVWECQEFSGCNGYNLVGIHMATGNGFDAGAVVTAMWHKIVSEYSHLALSVECDCLPAFAGFARQTETYKTGKYLAGLWEDSLAEDLLWRVDEPLQGRSQRRPRSYQAPTLS
ncbi:uncharacterized protein K441DRAFT_721366 [Cenococcum geophilum 1.58]|uniref:uncharacterized protein n=1 Tax=Cenococcum geophilum 1.58 TaxID=794803 RepID=UPI00358F5AE5|nr:hypothetical protein K441DRAFT_721366 [Cenococcum geophilum 1.58]